MNPEGRADISRDAQMIGETKKINKDVNILLSSQSPLAFVLMLTLPNLIKAEHVHNLQASECRIKKCV